MKVKQLALCFVFLLSSQYLLGVAAQVAQKKVAPKRKATCSSKSICSSGNSCSSSGCLVKPQLVKKLDQAFENIRDNLPNSIKMENTTVEKHLQAKGVASGFKEFRVVGPYTCVCGSGDFVRIFVDISFVQILLDFVLYLLEDLLGGLLGPLGKALAIILGDVVELLVKVLGLNIEVQITILQQFIPGTTSSIENFTIADVSDITLLGLNLYLLADLLSPILTPVLNLLLEVMLEGPVKAEFEKELQKLVITKGDVVC